MGAAAVAIPEIIRRGIQEDEMTSEEYLRGQEKSTATPTICGSMDERGNPVPSADNPLFASPSVVGAVPIAYAAKHKSKTGREVQLHFPALRGKLLSQIGDNSSLSSARWQRNGNKNRMAHSLEITKK